MENTTSQRGLHGLTGSSHYRSSGLVQSRTISMEGPFRIFPGSRKRRPGTKLLSRYASYLRPSEHPVSSRRSLYTCNMYSNPSHPGFALALKNEDDTLLVELISLIRRSMPGLLLREVDRKRLRLLISQRRATGCLLFWSETCYAYLLLSVDTCSHAEQPELNFQAA